MTDGDVVSEVRAAEQVGTNEIEAGDGMMDFCEWCRGKDECRYANARRTSTSLVFEAARRPMKTALTKAPRWRLQTGTAKNAEEVCNATTSPTRKSNEL